MKQLTLFLAIELFTIFGTLNMEAQTNTSIKNAKITVMADSVVEVGNKFHLRYIYEYTYTGKSDTIGIADANENNFDWKETNDGIQVIAGPTRSQSKSYSNINGKTKTTCRNTLYFILSFETEGRYKMPTLRIKTPSGEEIASAIFRDNTSIETDNLLLKVP